MENPLPTSPLLVGCPLKKNFFAASLTAPNNIDSTKETERRDGGTGQTKIETETEKEKTTEICNTDTDKHRYVQKDRHTALRNHMRIVFEEMSSWTP